MTAAAPSSAAGALVDRYAGVVVDVDGVLMRGHQAVPGAAATLAALRARGLGVALATNNASRSPDEVAGWLAGGGLAVDADRIVTSAIATARHLPRGSSVLVVGTAALRDALTTAGLRLVTAPDDAEIVVVGFNPQLRYDDLRDAALALQRPTRFVATNLDRTLPTEHGDWPGNGAICAALTAATGREPEVVGKPGAALIEAAVATLPAPDGPVLVVGDRLDTDIAAGVAAGCDTALVLTGVTGRDAAASADPAPTYVLDDVSALLRPVTAAR